MTARAGTVSSANARPAPRSDHTAHQVDAGGFLGHGMFDLKPGVHLEESEIVPLADSRYSTVPAPE